MPCHEEVVVLEPPQAAISQELLKQSPHCRPRPQHTGIIWPARTICLIMRPASPPRPLIGWPAGWRPVIGWLVPPPPRVRIVLHSAETRRSRSLHQLIFLHHHNNNNNTAA